MAELGQGLITAIKLILSLDSEVVGITIRSLAISASACLLATIVCLPLGSLVHLYRFPGRRLLISLVQTLYSIPTVLVGLLVFVLFSRNGPLGGLDLLFTPTIMVIGQVILVFPILLGLIISALSGIDRAILDTAISLGAGVRQTAVLLMREARFAVLTAVVMGFGRAISEVGLAIMVGGNIRGFTRVLTTTISLETSKGELELAFALGIILLVIALVVNITLNRIQSRS